jgi:hypothetical protein
LKNVEVWFEGLVFPGVVFDSVEPVLEAVKVLEILDYLRVFGLKGLFEKCDGF